MKKKLSVRELELRAAALPRQDRRASANAGGEAIAMLVRRGLQPVMNAEDGFFSQLEEFQADKLSEWLDHYAFRLFLRGAIQNWQGFKPGETTRYLTQDQSRAYARALVDLGLAENIGQDRYRLKWAARSFGGILEWYVSRELVRRYGFDVATGVKLRVRGGGGDLDVVAAAEGKLVYLELKSSPPRNLMMSEISSFWSRLALLRPDLAIFVVDTALRPSDKVLPMLADAFEQCSFSRMVPKRVAAQLWALTPHIYVVNGSRDLMANIGKAIAAGLVALSPVFGNKP
jgi:hypothetical protein